MPRIEDLPAGTAVSTANFFPTDQDGVTKKVTAQQIAAFFGSVAGDVVGPAGATDKTLPRFDLATGKLLQGSGVTVEDNNAIHGFKGEINKQTGTTYSLQNSDTGKIVELENAATVVVTCPSGLDAEFACSLVQTGAGQVQLSAGSGATIRHRQTHTKLAGQWAMASLYIRENAGSAAVYVFGGDTA